MKNTTQLTLLFLCLIVAGCYTTFRHPNFSADADSEDYRNEAEDPSCRSCHEQAVFVNPGMPAMKMSDYGWHYFYNSAWWQDAYGYGSAEDADYTPSPTNTLPRHYDRHEGSHVGTSPSSPTYSAPALGKKADSPSSNDTGSTEPDPRRDFDRRTETKKSESESREQVERQPKHE